MQTVKLEPRPLYAIGTVARLTGLKPDTLRIWERRYGLGASHRSDSGRRQYTQTDLEHLQLVATLVSSGVRIGEIAGCGRKTLEVMLGRAGKTDAEIPARKPAVLVIGESLCRWLDDHQGCLSHVNASLARVPLAEAEAALGAELPAVDLLVIGCEKLGPVQARQVEHMAGVLSAQQVLVIHQDANERSSQALQLRGFSTTAFPPDPGFLAFELSRCSADTLTRAGRLDLGDLVVNRPRQISQEDLLAAASLAPGAGEIEAARLAELVEGLALFEENVAGGAVDNWSDAATRACAYAYAGQARWLMERALQLVLSDSRGAGRKEPRSEAAGRLHDAA